MAGIKRHGLVLPRRTSSPDCCFQSWRWPRAKKLTKKQTEEKRMEAECILHLRWEHVDLERGLIFTPDSKSGRKAIIGTRLP